MKSKKIELLAPAGNLEKLKFAIIYGANAVYLGLKELSLRNKAGNFAADELMEAVKFAHQRGCKVYLAVNVFARNSDLNKLEKLLKLAKKAEVDAFIVADPGIFLFIKEEQTKIPIHISTQANITNLAAAQFWANLGAKRVTLARELSLAEIKQICKVVPVELEVFIHGAMCVSYSGRCLLSKYLAGRDSNQGDCAHSCRWKYYLMEEKRPGFYYPVDQDDQGFYFFNSKDLCLAKQIPQLIEAGLSSLKIEGRMKSLHYLATTVGTYRKIIETYYQQEDNFVFQENWMQELTKVSHRPYSSGFLFDEDNTEATLSPAYIRSYDFVGIVKGVNKKNGWATVEVRNQIKAGDSLEVFSPKAETVLVKKAKIVVDGLLVESVHANTVAEMELGMVDPFSVIRRKTYNQLGTGAELEQTKRTS
jgi:putative protease